MPQGEGGRGSQETDVSTRLCSDAGCTVASLTWSGVRGRVRVRV